MPGVATVKTTGLWRRAGLGLALATGSVQACKYNVRDAGFVDFEPAPYRLVVVTNLEPAGRDWQTELRRVAASEWLDANVDLELVSPVDPPPEIRAVLRNENAANEPSAVLFAPDGRALLRPFAVAPDQDAIWSLIEGTVDSPLRRQLAETLVDNFAVIIVAEGPDARENQRARQAAEGAVARFADRMPRLPKPVKEPPVVLAVRANPEVGGGGRAGEYAVADEVALWSLGLNSTNRVEAEVAVVYGRGRRSGPPLRGPDITETALLEVLTILGQDCECDLDRSWLRGPLLPLRWDAARQQQVVKELGFDAENPMVKTEISRIVARGPSPGARRVTFDEAPGDPFGYAEMSVESSGDRAVAGPAGTESAASPPTDATNAVPPAPSASMNGRSGPGRSPLGSLSMTMVGLVAFGVIGVVGVFLFAGRSR